jgi:hypothetical protein
MTIRKIAAVAGLVAGLGLSAAYAASSAQDDAAVLAKRSEFMRLKLTYAQGVLEGLALEKMDLVAANAKDLKEMSAAAQWEVPTVPGAQYNEYTAEFQRIANDLGVKAKAGNLDGATMAYMRLTMSCVECHKAVRGAMAKKP